MRFLDQIDVKDKVVLVRVDYNVPVKDGRIVDDNRIVQSLPTLHYALQNGAAIVACSHLGKPKGKNVPELSLAPVAKRLGELLNMNVPLAPDCIGPAVETLVAGLAPGQILMLENLRFHPGETANDDEFSKALAKGAQVYVNDAFGVSHRAHASVVGVTRHVPICCGGFLLQKEWQYLGEALKDPARPFVAISGGAKVSSKLAVLKSLLGKVDRLLIGGAMANTFLKAQGFEIGSSLVENDLMEEALKIMAEARKRGVSLYLPVDFIMGTDLKGELASGVRPYQDVPPGEMILDTGPATHVLFSEALKDAKTVVWNGPMGAFENRVFAMGSYNLASELAALDALTILGGGETGVIVNDLNIADKISFLSTGGGSFMEFLEGRELPAFTALEECD
ncbi:MAG: phosphoglycerate kinase [Deltaproteobacteria bacterium]|nr:phosphoglycerate kinase [Deltaproteobacteria bacterium]